jgi:hypothetical protein
VTVATEACFVNPTSVTASVGVPLPWPLYSADDLSVICANGAVGVLNVDYTVTLAPDFQTATLIPTASLVTKALGGAVLISRVTPATQPLDIPINDRLDERGIERELDRAAMRAAEAKRDILFLGANEAALAARTVRAPVGETLAELVSAGARADKVLGFSGTGQLALYPPTSGPTVILNGSAALFDTRTAVLLATIDPAIGWVETKGYATVGDKGGALYRRAASEPSHPGKVQSADGAWWELVFETATPAQFGGVGYTTFAAARAGTAATAAVQACFDFVRAVGGRVYFDRWYKVTDQIDAFPTAHYGVKGTGPKSSGVVVIIADRAKYGLCWHNSVSPSTRGAGFSASDFGVFDGSGNLAVLWGERYSTDSFVDNIYLSAYFSGASAVRLSNVFNSRWGRLHIWGAGAHRAAKQVPDTTTFSISSGGTTLTASANTFAAEDVNKSFVLSDGTTSQNFIISAYTTPTQVTTATPARAAFSAVRGTFGIIRGGTTNGSPTVTVEENAFSSADVGRRIIIPGAGRSTPNSGRDPLWTTIAAVPASNELTLADNAAATVAGARLILDPAFDINAEGSDQTNDFEIQSILIEDFRGCGMAVNRAINFKMGFFKSHAVGYPSHFNDIAGEACAIFASVQGEIGFLQMEQFLGSRAGRVQVYNASGGKSLALGPLHCPGQYGIPALYTAGGRSTGSVKVAVIHMFNSVDSTARFEQWQTDGTTGEPTIGSVSALQQVSTAQLLPEGIRFTTAGSALANYLEGTFTPVFSFASPADTVITHTVQVGRYTRIGNVVHFWIGLAFSTNAYGGAPTGPQIAGLPLPAIALSGLNYGGSLGRNTNIVFTGRDLKWVVYSNAQVVNFIGTNSGAGTTTIGAAAFPASTSFDIEIEGTYRVV